MEDAPSQRQEPGGPVKDVQPYDQGLDKLLRELLQVSDVPRLASSEYDIGQMGQEEI